MVKTWKNRLPIISDNLSHWNEIFTWRQQHYQFIAKHYNQQENDQGSNHSMLGVHASAQAIIHFGKVILKIEIQIYQFKFDNFALHTLKPLFKMIY